MYALYADLVGARNIALRTFLTWQDWVRTGLLSVRPDVSDDKTKAARLKRYAELRRSSDPNSSR
jgi:putative transposase